MQIEGEKSVELKLAKGRSRNIRVTTGQTRWKDAFHDVWSACANFKKWLALANYSIKRRYYTTGIGPFWLLISNALFILGVSRLYSGAFDIGFQHYLVHLGLGYLIWSIISDTFGAGGNIFISEYGIYSQLNINKIGLVLKGTFVRVIIFLYSLPLLAYILFVSNMTIPISLFALVGLAFIIVNSFFFSYVLSVVAVRYRDIPHIVGTIMRFAFFFTPILWEANNLVGMRAIIVAINPFYHMIELCRAPIMKAEIPWESVLFVFVTTVINVVLYLITYRLAHRKIVLYGA